MHETAAALLEAHVQHVLEGFRGERFDRAVEDAVSQTMAWLSETKLSEVSSPALIVGVIDRYVIEFRISGGIAELAGEMANCVFLSKHNDDTRLRDIISPEQVEGFVDEIASLGEARREIIHLIFESTSYGAIVANILERGIREAVLGREQASGPPGAHVVANLARNLARKWVPDLEQRVQIRIAHYLERKNVRVVEDSKRYIADALDEKCVRGIADEIWDAIASMRLSEIFAYLGRYDLDDFVVLGYEFWLQYRKTDYFRRIAEELVGHFFDKYGDKSVLCLIEDMGVTQAMVVHELQVLTLRLREHAAVTGFLEKQIRAYLEPFYKSQTVQEIVAH